MKLSIQDLSDLCKLACEAAKKAGQLISEYSKKKIEVKRKEGGDSLASQVVTEVDLKSQKIILDILQPSGDRYDLALLTEESPDDKRRFEKDYFWCIDPLDGTLPFTEGTPGYAVSIALVSRKGVPQIGVVYDPVEHTLYSAIRGQGACRNQLSWSLEKRTGELLRVYNDRSFLKDSRYAKTMNGLESLAKELGYTNIEHYTQLGAVKNAISVLENAPAIYFKLSKPELGGGSLWDFAATACIAIEAGAIVSDMNGNPLELNRDDTTFMNRHGVIYASDQVLAKQFVNGLVIFP